MGNRVIMDNGIRMRFTAVTSTNFQAMFKANKGNVQGYFLAGRDVGWWAVSVLRIVYYERHMA